MSNQTPTRRLKAAIDLRPPLQSVRFGSWYFVDAGTPSARWVTGYDLVAAKAPVKISAIAWRL